MTAVMIDIEAMSLEPTAALTSIGAVVFDPHTNWIGDKFHIDVSLEDCIRHGLTVSADTLLWWMRQADEARLAMAFGQQDAAPLITALEALHAWFPNGASIWAKQASYDIAALGHAFRKVGMLTPWSHRRECCMRRMLDCNPYSEIVNYGRPHHALDDAIHQARLVQHILQLNPDLDA